MFRKIPYLENPINLFSEIEKHCDYTFLFESAEGTERLARFSFIGFNPRITFESKGYRVKIKDLRSNLEEELVVEDPLEILRRIVTSNPIDFKYFRFLGGAVGYISYDSIRYWEKLPSLAKNESNFPDIRFGIYDDGIIFDRLNKTAYYYHTGEDRLKDLPSGNNQGSFSFISHTEPKVNISKHKFEEAVSIAKDYISAGDIFQVVLSKRYTFNVKGSLLTFYNSLKRINPSPYMYYMKMGKRRIIGSSPEMLVRVEGDSLKTYPIAGTRPVVGDEEKNKMFMRELLSDPKERAEHVMLVDMARNDLGKVSKFGSVKVSEFMNVYRFSHVQHIVSKVTGKLRENKDMFDVFKAVFPAGTVSGAPKVRAMEIIEELEKSRRGPYAGAVGYFSFNSNADFAIAIRSLFASRESCYIQAGAGIVADSIPEKEWFETEHKLAALLSALDSEEGDP